MNRLFRNTILIALVCCCIAGLPIPVVSGQNADPTRSTGQSVRATQNPLLEEMMTHDSAFGKIVSAVALGDSDKVHKAILSMHGTMDKTLEGVRTRTVTLPKNPTRIPEFIDMDLKFRAKLEALDRAARHNNQREMQRITNMLLAACVKCHQTFRQ